MGLSLAVTPIFRTKLTLVGARNTAFVTEYVTGMATVKSLQMEPVLERRYGDLLAHMRTLISTLLFLPPAASCATPSKSDLDAEVMRLCAIDGG